MLFFYLSCLLIFKDVFLFKMEYKCVSLTNTLFVMFKDDTFCCHPSCEETNYVELSNKKGCQTLQTVSVVLTPVQIIYN